MNACCSPVKSRHRAGFTIFEVVIAIGILATALTMIAGNVFTVSRANRFTNEQAVALDVATTLSERLQGTTWQDIGSATDPWSWHRRESTTAVNPPLTIGAGNPDHDLLATGLLAAQPGLRNLRVYLEYYTSDITAVVHDPREWQTASQDPAYVLPEAVGDLDLREVEDAIVMRVVVRWDSIIGSEQSLPLTFARRK